jgi:anaerobic ribonucleoside-triphosphate reductase
MLKEQQINKLDEQAAAINAKLSDYNLCKGTASILTRISGYFRAVENFNTGKQSEFMDRLSYKIK